MPEEENSQAQEAAVQEEKTEIPAAEEIEAPSWAEDYKKVVEDDFYGSQGDKEEQEQGEEEQKKEGEAAEEVGTATETPKDDSGEAGGEESKEESSKAEESPPATYKIKVNGVEKEKTLEELITIAQKGEAAEEKMQDAAETKKAVQKIFDNIVRNPMQVLHDVYVGKYGLTPDNAYQEVLKFSKQVVGHDWMLNHAPEDERKAYQEQLEIQNLRERDKILKQREDEDRRRVETEKAERLRLDKQKTIETEMASSLKEAGLPQDDIVIADVANKMLTMRAAGLDPTIGEAVKEYQQDMAKVKAKHQEISGALSEDEFIQKYPELAQKIANAVTSGNIEEVKTQRALRRKKPAKPPKEKKPSNKPRRMSSADLFGRGF